MPKVRVKKLFSVKELKSTPRDIKKFAHPDHAARVLQVLLDAVKQAHPDTLWHFHIKVRYSVPLTERK